MQQSEINIFHRLLIIVMILMSILSSVNANESYPHGIVFDGSIGTPPVNMNLEGPDYQIEENFGHRSNNNLFHSFEQFNLHSDESATFLGSPGITNVISRITGGHESWINGTIKSNISGANFFFMNPSGIVFGPNAHLDLNASFHASTADYLLMENHERFYSSKFQSSVLSASPPMAFGFLENNIGSISIHQSDLSVEANNTLSLYSQDINIDNADILSPDGYINIVNTGLPGNYLLNQSIINQSSNQIQGTVHLSNNSSVCTTGDESSGNIFILGGNLFIENKSILDASSYGKSGGEIKIHVNNLHMKTGGKIIAQDWGAYPPNPNGSDRNKGADIEILAHESFVMSGASEINSTVMDDIYYDAGKITIQAKTIHINENSGIKSQTLDAGRGGDIHITATDSFVLSDGTISTSTKTNNQYSTLQKEIYQGHAGNITISGSDISFVNGGGLSSQTYGVGKGGNIDIINAKNIHLSGTNASGFACTFHVYSYMEDSGDSGNVTIQSHNLTMKDGAAIFAGTKGLGTGGNIGIQVTDNFEILGVNPMGPNNEGYASGLFSRSEGTNDNAGDAGIISIDSNNFVIKETATVSTSSNGPGNAGNIDISSKYIQMNANGLISSESNGNQNAGEAGAIDIKGEQLHLKGNSQVSTNAIHAGGGKINIQTKGLFLSINSDITTNVLDGTGKGGDISLGAHQIVINKNTKISANAVWGDGGAIFIESDVYIKSPESIVEATSERGNDGEVKIDAPDLDISSALINLTSKFLDASQWMKDSCRQRSSENISRLIVQGKDAVPTNPDDLHSSPAIVFQDIFFKQSEIKVDITKAEVCYQKGDFESAANIWYNVEKRLNKKSKDYLSTVTYLIQALQSIGFHYKALALANKTLTIAEQSKPSSEYIHFYNTFGDILLSVNELPDAIKYLKIALNAAKESKNPEIMALVMNNIANAVIVDGDINTGIQIYDNALIFLSNSDNKAIKAKIYLNLAYVISMIGTYEEAMTAFNDALTMIESLIDSHEKAFDYISLSKIGLMIDNFFPGKHSRSKTCFRLLESAQAIGEKIQNLRVISMASGNAAKIFEKSRQYEKALKKTRYAIFTAEQINSDEIAYKWHWQAARLFQKMGNETQAIDSYKKAISILSGIREQLFSGIRLKLDIFELYVKPVYLGLTEIYLDQADRESHPKLKEQKILLARDVMERLKNAELSDYFEDECVAKKQNKKTNGLNRTPEGVALLYPIALPERLTVLITLPDRIKHYNLDISYNELNKLVRSYRKYIQVRSSNHFLGISQKLYNLLIHPVQNDLIAANINTLLVAPDGVLRLIPFASLHDKKNFLIENYAIVTIPSINLTDTTVSHHKQNMETLVAGLSGAVQNFSALPSVKEELKDIKTIMNADKIYINKAFTIPNIQKEFKTNDYSIVHFATHGVFGGTAKHSFLLTYESQLDMNALEELMSLGNYRNHQVDMLTLSACQTALGNERAALGLAGVAVKAGVKSAVATLWYVDDQATSLAIRELYRQLKKEDITKAKALQNAQKMLLSKRQYWHPIYWAPFLLIGSWI